MAYVKSFDFNTLKKIAWEGDRHTVTHTDGHRPVGRFGENKHHLEIGTKSKGVTVSV